MSGSYDAMTILLASSLLIGLQIVIVVLAENTVSSSNSICTRANECDRTFKERERSGTWLTCDEFIECMKTTSVQRNTTTENITESLTVPIYSKLWTCALDNANIAPLSRRSFCHVQGHVMQSIGLFYMKCMRLKHLCFQIELGHIEYSNRIAPVLCKAILQCTDNMKLFNGMVDFPTDITKFCPSGKFCFINRTTLPTDRYSSDRPTCSCSCEYDCGNTGSCCFAEIDYYNSKSNPGSKRECFVNSILDIGVLGIKLVDTCFDRSKCSGDFKLVSDPENQLIYQNEGCAVCNCVYKVKVWETGIICSKSKVSFLDIDTLSVCPKVHIIPDEQLIRDNLCDSMWNSCPERFHNQLQEQLIANCKSIFAPMILYKWNPDKFHRLWIGLGRPYKNPYCAWCLHEKYFLHGNNGLKQLHKDNNLHLTPTVRLILIPDIMTMYTKSNPRQKSTSHCMTIHGKERCFDVFCPDGMVRIQDTCTHFVKDILHVTISLLITLRPVSSRIPADLIKATKLLKLNSWIRTHCTFKYPEKGNKVYLVEEMRSGSWYIKELVTWSINTTRLTLPTFLPILRKCFRKKWEIKVGNTSILVTAQLSKHKAFDIPEKENQRLTPEQQGQDSSDSSISEPQGQLSSGSRVSEHENDNTQTHWYPEQFQLLVDTSHPSLDVDFYLTKLFYCEQITVSWLDVRLVDGQMTVNHNDKVIEDGEYQLTTQGQAFFARMCLEDFTFAKGCSQVFVDTGTINVAVPICLFLVYILSI